ncbi:MAG: hypothetical protein JW913_19005 [Chitinispirillaceae bacterium]|nr:hypothetical protein [Chitinispirillaceae bacterium]
MRGYMGGMFALASLFIFSCEPWMLYEEKIPEFKAPADKALIVIYRGENPYGVENDATASFYVDGKFVSGNDQETIISFPIDPGKHFIMGYIDGYCKTRCDFQAGKVFYLQHKVFPILGGWGGIHVAGHSLTFRTPDEKAADFKNPDDEFKYARFNPKQETEDMEEDDYKEEIESYEEWLKDHQAEAKKDLEYPGY